MTVLSEPFSRTVPLHTQKWTNMNWGTGCRNENILLQGDRNRRNAILVRSTMNTVYSSDNTAQGYLQEIYQLWASETVSSKAWVSK